MTNGTSQGLFIVVAIVIFGIFVGLSYTLFGDELSPALQGLFGQSTEQAGGNLTGKIDVNVDAFREDEHFVYAKIREENPEKNEKEVWVKAEKLEDGTLSIVGTDIQDRTYVGSYEVDDSSGIAAKGEITFPDRINNMKIIGIKDNVFKYSAFTGKLRLPSHLKYLGDYAFYYAKFSGEMELPSTLIEIGDLAFDHSLFTGKLELPASLTYIGTQAFYKSKFSGDLDLPDGLNHIGQNAFIYSKFSGDLELPSKLTYIGDDAFQFSLFSGELVLPQDLTYVGSYAFEDSTFSGEIVLPKSLQEVGFASFRESTFTKLIKQNPDVFIDSFAFQNSTF